MLDGQTTGVPVTIAQIRRPEHIAILGKTGSGKSMLLRHFAGQDIQSGRGFVFFDLHGDATPVLLKLFAQYETVSRQDVSRKLIVIEPSDRDFSMGLNLIEPGTSQNSFVQIAEFATILRTRWNLDSFGARTEELLRNALHVLSDNRYTLLELSPLLTNTAFRALCLRRTENTEVRDYFATRYDRTSEAQQATWRDAILNKVSAFTADPHFRHIVGQTQSSFSLGEAIDSGHWIILNLDKGRLGEQAATLGSLFLTKLKNALFARQSRSLFTIYCDEIQNLVVFDSGLDTLLSEARKFGISIVTANQFLDQHPPAMRSALAAVGTHIFFALSSTDAEKIAGSLDGGRTLAQELKNLPQRHFLLKSGHHRALRSVVPPIAQPNADARDLLRRSRDRFARRRTEVEADIQRRHQSMRITTNEVLHDWQ
ncbi:MAG: type IV secretion system DNA-binding domain-containing protein [Bryobacteraceae bacterium]|nr:type IV secretion system DNA-binding domain-containing protein [Bryobacteraceae bacterium]